MPGRIRRGRVPRTSPVFRVPFVRAVTPSRGSVPLVFRLAVALAATGCEAAPPRTSRPSRPRLQPRAEGVGRHGVTTRPPVGEAVRPGTPRPRAVRLASGQNTMSGSVRKPATAAVRDEADRCLPPCAAHIRVARRLRTLVLTPLPVSPGHGGLRMRPGGPAQPDVRSPRPAPRTPHRVVQGRTRGGAEADRVTFVARTPVDRGAPMLFILQPVKRGPPPRAAGSLDRAPPTRGAGPP